MNRKSRLRGIILTISVSVALLAGCDDTKKADVSSQKYDKGEYGIKTVPDFKIDNDLSEHVTPTQGLIYVVSMRTISGSDKHKWKIDLEFSDLKKTKLTGSDFEASRVQFEEWVKNYRTNPGQLKRPKKRCKKKGDDARRNRGKKCPAEIDKALSTSNEEVSFIAFVLDRKIENWRYIREERPNTNSKYDDEVIKIGHDAERAYYGNLRKFDVDGEFYEQDSNCRINQAQICDKNIIGAYFVANGYQRATDSSRNYIDSLNLYVEIIDGDGQPTPIIIDPDVRWPGGNDD